MKKALLLIAILFSSCCVAKEAAKTDSVPLLPAEYFGGLPDVGYVTLSPDGKKLASFVKIDTNKVKGTSVQVVNLESGKSKLVLFSDNIKFHFYNMSWKNNKTLLVHIFYPHSREVYGPTLKSRETDLIVVHLDTGDVNNVFSHGFLARWDEKPFDKDSVVDLLRDDDDYILMAVGGPLVGRIGFAPGVFKVNIRNQRADIVMEPARTYTWIADQQHRVRAAAQGDYKGNSTSIVVRSLKDDKWRELLKYDSFYAADYSEALGFGADPNIFYFRAHRDGRMAVYKVDLSRDEWKPELVRADPKYDVDGALIYSRKTKDVIGIESSYGIDQVFIDPEYQALQSMINKALPNTHNRLYSFSDDEQRYLVYSDSDVDSGTYYLGDRSKGSLEVLAFSYKNLHADQLAHTRPYNYRARDGLEIEGFLTIPAGAKDKNLPVIVLPHGGPQYSDTGRFDYWRQFFANRGYAVLQPNFRGSTGRGWKFRNAGLMFRSLGAQNDIEDGVKKLIADGIADSKRICIVGASYGGYSALLSATRKPDLYACAISVAGISDVTEMRLYDEEGERVRDGKLLREISPINYVKNVKIPILLIHGKKDRQVEFKQSEIMYKALKKAHKKVSFVQLEDQDHFLDNNGNRIKTFVEMDKFLKKYMPTEKMK